MVVNGQRRVVKNRVHCLSCVPWKQSPYRQKSVDEKRVYAAKKQKSWRDRKIKETGLDPIRQKRLARKKKLVDHLGGCQICGYKTSMRSLVFHHLSNKSFPLTERTFQFSWSSLLPEIEKCVLVCSNHHGEVHDGTVDVKIIHSAMLEKLKNFGTQ